MERGVRTDSEGRKGHVVKTIRLKGQYSQGLVMPLGEFSGVLSQEFLEDNDSIYGADVTDYVGVWKWEPPIPAQLSGKVRGGLPGWVRKTDAERIQNFEDFLPLNPDDFYCTEKIDGSSATFTLKDGDFHVCSRNLDLEETEGNTFWEIAKKYKIEYTMRKLLSIHTELDYLTIQGEIYGEGINGNRLGLKGHHFAVFNVELPHVSGIFDVFWDVEHHLPFVPKLDILAPQSVSEALSMVDGMKSALAKDRLAEGVVWRRKDGEDIIPGVRAVKAISNKYLLKEK
jgi:RNA ligase (TIGR02306 family)